jgi:hypothetical protein
MRNEKKIAIYWNCEIVGYVVEPSSDHLALFGRWVPVKGTAYDGFMRQFEHEEDVRVALGKPDDPHNTTVNSAPGDMIEIKFYPD